MNKIKYYLINTLMSILIFGINLFLLIIINGIIINDLDVIFGSLLFFIPSVIALYFVLKERKKIKKAIIKENIQPVTKLNNNTTNEPTDNYVPQISIKINNPYVHKENTNNPKFIRKSLSDYCVLDLETTGLYPDVNEIIEVGILKIRNNAIIDSYSNSIDIYINYYKIINIYYFFHLFLVILF